MHERALRLHAQEVREGGRVQLLVPSPIVARGTHAFATRSALLCGGSILAAATSVQHDAPYCEPHPSVALPCFQDMERGVEDGDRTYASSKVRVT